MGHKRVIRLTIRDEATKTTVQKTGEMARECVPGKCISGHGMGESGRLLVTTNATADRAIEWRSSPPRALRSHTIAEGAIQQS